MSYMNPFAISNHAVNDARYVNDALSFLNRELEKVDPKIQEPLASTWWPRDMPVRTGGGFVDNVSLINVTYGSTGANEDSFIGEQTNEIPDMQADFDKDKWRTFNWAQYMNISYIQQEKLIQIGRNILDYLNKGIRLKHDKDMDRIVYTGLTRYGITGLINTSTIHRYAVANNAAGTSTLWANKTADEILIDINTLIAYTWGAVQHVTAFMANHLLLPTAQYSNLVTRKVGSTGDKSILTYVLENNIGKQQGHQLIIDPLPMLAGAGAGTPATDRMVAYCNSLDAVRIDETVPLRRLATETQNMMFKTPFVSQMSEVQFLTPESVAYADGI